MYRVLVSANAYDSGQSGISDYINNVVAVLSEQHRVDVILLDRDVAIFPVKNANVSLIRVPNRYSRPIINMLWHLFIPLLTINFKKYDFILLPAGNRRLFCFYPIFTIATFHDLSQFHIDNKYDSWRMFYIQKLIPLFLKKVDRIVAVSRATKTDLVKYYGINEERITVAYNGYNSGEFNEERPLFNTSDILSNDKRYILYVARVEYPGKNHLNLVKAYELLPSALKNQYNLVCAGGLKERSEIVLEYVQNSLDRDNIKFTGFVPTEHLSPLYKNSSLFVLPSFYEGFGIPLVEAMACGIPVTCSDRGPLPEVTGEASLLFNPDNPQDICDKIIDILSHDDKRSAMISAGLKRAKLFSWHKHTQIILDLYERRDENC